MIVAILNSAISDSDTAMLDSDTLLSSPRFTQKHSTSTLTLIQLIHSDSNSFILTQLGDGSHLEFCHLRFRHCNVGIRHLFFPSDSLKKHSPSTLTLTQTILSDSDSFILTQLDYGTHLGFCHHEFGHLGISHLSFPLKLTHTCQDWFPPFVQKKTLIHSFRLNVMMAAIWNSAIMESALHCGIQTPCFLLSDSLKNILTLLWLWLKLIQTDSNSFILTQRGDGSHLEFCHLRFRHCNVGFRHLVIFSQIHSKTLYLHSDSDPN